MFPYRLSLFINTSSRFCVNVLWRVVLTLKISPEISKVKPEKAPPNSLSLARSFYPPSFTYLSVSLQNYWAILAACRLHACADVVGWLMGNKFDTLHWLSLHARDPPGVSVFASFDQAQTLFHAVTCHLVISHLLYFFSVKCIFLHGLFSWPPPPPPPTGLSLPICVSDLTTRLK